MIVYPLLETNKRIRLSQYTLGAGGNGVLRESAFMNGKKIDGEEESWHMLDAYFPFDPYQLPISRRWIASDYVEWKGIPGEDDRDDSTNGEDEGDGGLDLEDEDVDTATENDEETT
jgi:RNA polymerase I-specific transcription initiation factor RRN3